MKLAIDIGNTSTSIGLFDEYDIIKKNHFNTIDDFILFLNDIKKYHIECAIISSVVPHLTIVYKKILIEDYHFSVFIIDYKSSGLVLKVRNPETVGLDRICNIFAVIKDYDVPAIIVDFGTATTYDVINRNSEFIGGAIATGIETSTQYLIDKAALLSKTELIFPDSVIGTDTTTNIQSGVMFGAVDQVEGMIQRIQKETNMDYLIFLTGGFSNLLAPKLSINHTVDIDLTLKGIISIYDYNNK
ncbi:MAG: pantothenate kinase [Candidatus Marinimicrobia bacterium]|nr:pantothenate kinase [Candidatus Neomarinimicrobiota bacterium]|tara:strand:+ start:84176 stop:84907 length:732 start_codon:yes stop_codon:yes gene_type:complete